MKGVKALFRKGSQSSPQSKKISTIPTTMSHPHRTTAQEEQPHEENDDDNNNDNNNNNNDDDDAMMTSSAPTILIRAPPANASSRRVTISSLPADPPRGIMTSKTLHESLHRIRSSPGGGRDSPSSTLGVRRTVSFTHVNIREYERILGDNPSVTAGPPLSIGWRHTLEPIVMNVDEYENGKGSPRNSSEFLVPKAVREKLLKEHACVSRRDMAMTIRQIQKEKAKRRKTATNLNFQGTEEFIESMRRNLKTILKPALTYQNSEAKLWDEAHIVAMEKAKRLEESIHRGETVRPSDLYKVGTICHGNSIATRGSTSSSNHVCINVVGSNVRRKTEPPIPSLSSMVQHSGTDTTTANNMDEKDSNRLTRRGTAPSSLLSSTLMELDKSGKGGKSNIMAKDNENGRDVTSTKLAQTSPSRSSSTDNANDQYGQTQQHEPEERMLENIETHGNTQIRRGSHAGSNIVATEDGVEDDILAQLNLDDLDHSSS